MLSKKNHIIYKKNKKTLWVHGKHSVSSILKNKNRKIHQIVFTNEKLFSEFKNLIPDTIKVRIEKTEYLNNLFINSANHQNCAVEIEYLIQPNLSEIVEKSSECLIILDQITDPHNVGAIIRSAAAFSAAAVITTNDNSPDETAALIKSACGAFEIIPYIKVVNLSSCIDFLKKNNYWCIGLDVHSDNYIDSIPLPPKLAFIMGSEDLGLRKLTKKNCDLLVKLPISDKIDSLNVSNALAITLYEYNRQLKLKA